MERDLEGKLRALLNHAFEHVPYYRGVLPDPIDLSSGKLLDFLATLPILTRNDIQSEKTRLISHWGEPSSWFRTQTSGTSGEPIEVVLTTESRAIEASLLVSHIESCLGSSAWRTKKTFHLTLHPESRSRTLPAVWHEDGLMTKWNLLRVWQLPDEQFMELITSIDDSVVTVMPSVAYLLCSRIRLTGSKQKIQPSLVLMSGEGVPQNIRTLVEETFGCPVSSLYTMAEVGIVGLECPDHEGYCVADESAIVEIVGSDGVRLPPGIVGDILVTPLNNLAMPLIRYRSGDRGYWDEKRRIRLVKFRQPEYLNSSSGAKINIVRFVKVFASLKVENYKIEQDTDGIVFIYYSRSTGSFDEAEYLLVRSVIRGALGLNTVIRIIRENKDLINIIAKNRLEPDQMISQAEPSGPDPEEIAEWLRERLTTEPAVHYALLTGSYLEPTLTSRFSDIDCNIFIQGNPEDTHWLELIRTIKSTIPKISINLDVMDRFSERAPLVACRILSEQIPIIGKVDESVLPWPTAADLRLHGLYWSQDALATLRLRLADSDRLIMDPVYEAWLATKYVFQAFRFHFLLQGDREISTDHLRTKIYESKIASAAEIRKLHEAFQVSRELIPAPLYGSDEAKKYLHLALTVVRIIQQKIL